jgi:hypothetical protein
MHGIRLNKHLQPWSAQGQADGDFGTRNPVTGAMLEQTKTAPQRGRRVVRKHAALPLWRLLQQ